MTCYTLNDGIEQSDMGINYKTKRINPKLNEILFLV